MTDYTPNLNLDLYEDTDKPNLRDQYNSAMNKIDTDLSTPFTSNRLADGAVTSAKIYDGAVTTDKVADNAITGAKIADGSITSADFADGAITTAKIADEAVTTAKIADEAVTTAKIDDEAVTTAKIADDAVTTIKVLDAAITTDKIADGAITPEKLSLSVDERYCVWIGDSYSTSTYAHGSTNQPYRFIPKQLNCTVKNYAINGAGFLRNSSINFPAQALTAAADDTYTHENVDWVFIFGGQNDVYQFGSDPSWTYSALVSNFADTINTLKSAFTNARIVVIGVNSASTFRAPSTQTIPVTGNVLSDSAIAHIYQLLCAKHGVCFINTTLANVLMNSHFDNDDSHPVDAGYLELDSVIMSGLFGNSSSGVPARRFPAASNYSSVENTGVFSIAGYSDNTPANWDVTINNSSGLIANGRYSGFIQVTIAKAPANGGVYIQFPGNLSALPTVSSPIGVFGQNRLASNTYSGWLPNCSNYTVNGAIRGIILQVPNEAVNSARAFSVYFDFPLI